VLLNYIIRFALLRNTLCKSSCSLRTNSSVMETAEHREPYESRGSRADLGAPGGESPPGDSTNPSADRGRANDGFRRVSPVASRPREGPLTEPTAAIQPWRRLPLLMPHCGHCQNSVLAHRVDGERPLSVGGANWSLCPRTAIRAGIRQRLRWWKSDLGYVGGR